MTICENFPLEKLRIAQFVKIFPLENNPLYGTFVCHNEIRDITAEWLDRVYHVVVVEPPLQPLTGENIIPATANRKDDARADIHARGFWGRRQSAFFDVRVFHPNAQSYRNSSISAMYRRQEIMKKGSMVTEFGR